MVGLNTVVFGIGSEVESAILVISILPLLQALLLVESGFLSSIMSLGCELLSLLTAAKEHFFIVLSFVEFEEALVVGLCLYA